MYNFEVKKQRAPQTAPQSNHQNGLQGYNIIMANNDFENHF
jgi:hypothetical protein